MKLNCIIIDDEPLARKGLKEYVQDIDFLELRGEFENPLKAASVLASGDVQLIFLDIQMPKVSGIDFYRSLQNRPPVIFTTAYPEYALDGFDLNALDYLVKPISFARFLAACLKAKEYYTIRQAVKESASDDFFIKEDGKIVRLNMDEILFVEALQNYVVIQTTTRKHITYLTLAAVREFLPEHRFFQSHKSYIVSGKHIDNIEGNIIRIGIHEVPISRTMKEELLENLLKGKFLKR